MPFIAIPYTYQRRPSGWDYVSVLERDMQYSMSMRSTPGKAPPKIIQMLKN